MELGESSVWDDPDRAQALGRERANLEQVVETIENLDQGVEDCRELLDMAVEEEDEDSVAELKKVVFPVLVFPIMPILITINEFQ